MDYVKINGVAYDVIVAGVEENFNILYSENTGRTISVGARMTLDPLGSFFGHNVIFCRKPGKERVYDQLYTFLSEPRYDGIPIEIVHNQETIAYDAYVSSGARALQKIDKNTGKVYWGEFTVNFVPMEAQVTP